MASYWKKHYTYTLLIFILAFAQYANTLQHSFVWDDKIVLTENYKVKQGISGIPQLFERGRTNEITDRYGFRPVTLTLFAILYEIFGANPLPYHITHVLLYAIFCALLMLSLPKLIPTLNTWTCFLAMLLFTCHPIHTEVVANIKSADEILAFLLSWCSLLLLKQYLQLQNNRQWSYFLASMLVFALALLAKESALFWVPIVVVYAIYLKNANLKKTIPFVVGMGAIAALIVPGFLTTKLLILPLLLLATLGLYFIHQHVSKLSIHSTCKYAAGAVSIVLLAIGIIIISTQQPTIDTQYINKNYQINTNNEDENGFYLEDKIMNNALFAVPSYSQRLANSVYISGKYLINFLYPNALVYFYGFNQIPVVGWANPWVLLALAIQLFLIFGVLWLWNKNKLLVFFLLFYLLSTLPYLHIIVPLDDAMADRFFFIASLAASFLVVFFIHTISSFFKQKIAKNSKNIFVSSLCFLLAAACFLTTFNRNKAWKNDYTLFKTDMPKLEHCARANYYLGSQYLNKFYETNQPKYVEKSINRFQKSINISPAAFFAYRNLTQLYIDQQNWQKALTMINDMLSHYPNSTEANYLKGLLFFRQEKHSEAIPIFTKVVANKPSFTLVYYELAWAYYNTGQTEQAITTLKNAIEIKPTFLDNYGALSDIYYDMGLLSEAMEILQKALKIDPNGAPIYDKMIQQYIDRGEEEQAQRLYEEAKTKGIF